MWIHDVRTHMYTHSHTHIHTHTHTQITELAGYTSRVSEMLHVFEEVDQGRYQVVSVAEDLTERKEKDGECIMCRCCGATWLTE